MVDGTRFTPFDRCVADLSTPVIADALGGINRFTGHHIGPWYSVAEHCVLVSLLVQPRNRLWAAVHDVPEALGLNDLCWPVKKWMAEYRLAESVLMQAVCRYYGLGYSEPEEVKKADRRLLSAEQILLQPDVKWLRDEIAERGHKPLPPHIQIQCLNPRDSRDMWLERMRELGAYQDAA